MLYTIGSLYPGGGRATLSDMTMLGPYDQQEISESDTPTPAITSDLTQANVVMGILILVAALWLMNFI